MGLRMSKGSSIFKEVKREKFVKLKKNNEEIDIAHRKQKKGCRRVYIEVLP